MKKLLLITVLLVAAMTKSKTILSASKILVRNFQKRRATNLNF
ncbi:hypothetical protein [Flavobacterium wongokense]|nr:hypothetical protein [Flavobacterium sp. WG47]